MDIDDLKNTGHREKVTPGTGTDHLGEIIKAELELGRRLFMAGAPGQRILDSITFLNEKLQGGSLHVFLGFEAMVITLENGVESRSGMCDYPLPVSMNANTIVEISHYLHSLPDGKAPSEVLHELESLTFHNRINTILTVASVTIFTVIFGYFNHADAWGLLVIGIAVLISALVRELVIGRGHGYYIGVLATTLVATVTAALLSQVVPTTTPLISLIIPCVFVIPGFQLINGGWEVLRNHMHIGIPRLVVFLNVLAIMTVGLLAVLLTYTPGTDGPGLTFPVPWTLVTQRDPWRSDSHLHVRPHARPPPGYPRVFSLWCGWPDRTDRGGGERGRYIPRCILWDPGYFCTCPAPLHAMETTRCSPARCSLSAVYSRLLRHSQPAGHGPDHQDGPVSSLRGSGLNHIQRPAGPLHCSIDCHGYLTAAPYLHQGPQMVLTGQDPA